VLRASSEVEPGDAITVRLHEGRLRARVEDAS
jgi:ribosomal 50S subunit-recycling heat shock protein